MSSSISSSSSSTNPTSNKKAKKTSRVKEEIELIKQYILHCPTVPSTSIAVQTCLTALTNEMKRIERDEKLQRKFAQVKAVADAQAEAGGIGGISGNVQEDDDVVCVEMSASTENLMKKATANANANSNSNSNGNGSNNTEEDARLAEWQDVDVGSTRDKHMKVSKDDDDDKADTPSHLGISLAQCAISDMSSANIHVSTPIAALALALHASLRSDILGFKCTGVPEEEEACFSSDIGIGGMMMMKKKKSNGFAPPVRELPKGKFLPDNWDKFASSSRRVSTLNQDLNPSMSDHRVTLRYRKNGTGATILRVTHIQDDDDITLLETTTAASSTEAATATATISFGPADGEAQILKIPINRHVNVDGLNAALDKCQKVKPALHYKSLSLLLSDFCKSADLGSIKESSNVNVGVGVGVGVGVDVNGDVCMDKVGSSTTSATISGIGTERLSSNNNNNNGMDISYGRTTTYRPSPNIQDDLLGGNIQRNMPGGDFAADILPSSFPAPGFANPRLDGTGGVGGSCVGGNLMGINHPYFQGNFDDYNDQEGGGGNFPGIGGLGMQPRFDSYYPPGVSNGRGGRGRFGRGGGRGRFGRGRGGRGSRDFSGDPNPDHERPPNTFGTNNDDMFM